MKRGSFIREHLAVSVGISLGYVAIMVFLQGIDDWIAIVFGAVVAFVTANLVFYWLRRGRQIKEREEERDGSKTG